MKKRIFGLISILIGVMLSLAALEVVAIAWMQIEDGHYTPATELFDRTQNTYVRDMTKGSDCRYVDTLFPHPYLAFVHHANPPCGKPNVNNIGLLGEDFPTVKRPDRYTILLTGGSVASQLGQIAPPPAPRYLQDELNAHYVSPTGKPFLVLNGGDGAWKEPQAFILFAMYSTSVDAVVTLDGFNEHYMFWKGTKERLERPLSNFLDVNPFVADENFGDAAVGWVIGRVAGMLSSNPVLGHSHAAYMVVRGIEATAKSKDIFASGKRTTLASMFAMPPEIVADYDREFAVQLELYQKYARSIEAIARDQSVKTAYFMQPAPAIGKTLTEEEVRNAGDLGYRDLYTKMVAGMLSLHDRGMAIFDLADVFKDEKGTIYEDHIHFHRDAAGESRGYRLVATAMAQKMAETWGLQPKK